MAKVPSPFLTGATGKFAGAAFQQSPGNGTILREVVKPTNPSTEAQVEQRAKFKLMSQVATLLHAVIAMKREGNITPRNMFVKINSPLLSFNKAQSRAKIELTKLQLTKSVQNVSMSTGYNEETGMHWANIESQQPIFYGAVFVLISYREEGVAYIKAIGRKTKEAAIDQIYQEFDTAAPGDVVLAYGIMQDTAGLAVKYGNIEAGQSDAWLEVLNNLAQSSSLTQTIGATFEE